MFKYKYLEFKYFYGLDMDLEGYIFVVGRDSNNIYIFFLIGELIKIILVFKLKCIKFRKDFRVCFIGSEKVCKIRLCEFRCK